VTPLLAVAVSGAALGLGAPALLARLPRLERWPLLTAWLWLTAALGALAAAGLAGLLLVLPATEGDRALAELLHTCAMAVREALTTPTDGPGTATGIMLLAAVGFGVAAGTGVVVLRVWRARWRHRALLRLAGRAVPHLPGVTVLEHPAPLAWCLPGPTGPVVFSTAALDRLEPEGLAAVLAHERAHQASRHHALVLVAEALRVGCPWLPAARVARQHVAGLVELAADDTAARRCGRAALASALAVLGGGAPAPEPALPAGGVSAAARITRLASPPSPGGQAALAVALAVVVLPLLAQLGAVAEPVARIAGAAMCPLP
jgi:Zn-dependent protease with chaperone function